VTPQPPTQAQSMKAMVDSATTALNNAAKGAGFDRQYIDLQVQAHQQTLTDLQRFQTQAQNADLKSLIEKAIPKVQQHLQRAKDVQGKLTAA
jgi:putative membrane protein